MNKRTKTGQKKHDESVLRSAEWYKKHGLMQINKKHLKNILKEEKKELLEKRYFNALPTVT